MVEALRSCRIIPKEIFTGSAWMDMYDNGSERTTKAIQDKICSLSQGRGETLSVSGFTCSSPQTAAASPVSTTWLSVLRYKF